MKRCLDEATLQAYLDGELSPAAARDAATHLAACDVCAASLAEAEGETAFFAAAFAPDASLNVPTATLRARVNAAVAQLESASAETSRPEGSGWSFNSLVASLSGLFALTPRRAAAFAGVAAVFVLFVSVFFIDRQDREQGNQEIAVASGPDKTAKPTPAPSQETASNPPMGSGTKNTNDKDRDDNDAPAPSASRGRSRRQATPFTPVPAKKLDKKLNQQLQVVPDERQYQTVIAKLDETIKSGESMLKPKVIADYERNKAVLDRAIEETRRVALQNPQDKDAASFLRAAYQSKIDLMTTVADSAQVATLDRD